jgi:hypothetical protein
VAEFLTTTVLSGVCVLRMNSVMERWVQTCRRELLDRTLIWNQRHLVHALHEYETHYNHNRAHQAMQQAAPLRAAPAPITDPQHITDLDIRRDDRLGGIVHKYQHAARPGWTTLSAGALPAPEANGPSSETPSLR